MTTSLSIKRQKIFYFKNVPGVNCFVRVFILKCSWRWYMFLFKNMYVYGNMYPGGKVQENVGHRGWWLSVICDLVWSCRCCTRCTTYFIWWGQKFIVVVESLSSVIWCGHIWCDHIWCGWIKCVLLYMNINLVWSKNWCGYVESVSVSLVWSQIWCGCRL